MEYHTNLENNQHSIWQWQMTGWGLLGLIWVTLPVAVYLYTNTDPVVTFLIVTILSLTTCFCFARARDLQSVLSTEQALQDLRQSSYEENVSKLVDSLVRHSPAANDSNMDQTDASTHSFAVDTNNVIKFPKTFNHVE